MTEDSESPDDEVTRVTFRVSEEKVERLDDLIWENKVAGHLHKDENRSNLLRQQLDVLIDELEGNLNSLRATAD